MTLLTLRLKLMDKKIDGIESLDSYYFISTNGGIILDEEYSLSIYYDENVKEISMNT